MSLAVSYFDEMYAENPDPWGFTRRWYERRKYALTLAALPRERYRRAFEPGCSIGVLTEQLASRCDELLAVDPSAAAVARTRSRVGHCPQVTVAHWGLPRLPPGRYDLIVLSEVGYYLDAGEFGALLPDLLDRLEPGGDLVAVHWRPRVPEYPQTGDAVHEAIRASDGLARTVRHVETDFLLESWTRTPPAATSVAQREGLC